MNSIHPRRRMACFVRISDEVNIIYVANIQGKIPRTPIGSADLSRLVTMPNCGHGHRIVLKFQLYLADQRYPAPIGGNHSHLGVVTKRHLAPSHLRRRK